MNELPESDRRRAGVLLHPTSLPDGSLGSDAYRFVDFLAAHGTSVWQMLPLGPTHAEGSPYRCQSVQALNPALLSIPRLMESGWLSPTWSGSTRDQAVRDAQACLRQPGKADAGAAFEAFCVHHLDWLEDYALFQALRERHAGLPWWEWPKPYRDRNADALEVATSELGDRLNATRFEQYLLAQQFEDLRAYAHARDIRLFGDMPIFVAHDSAEVWARRDCFKLDAGGHLRVVAGVPPDYFSETGQRWGNPLYDWEHLANDGFQWWVARLTTEFQRFDLVRIDHFRGFEACWEIPAAEPTAIHGRWVKVPGEALFQTLRAQFGQMPLVAEDLGIITPEVVALREQFGLPGMLVLQFAFDGGPKNPYLPHNHRPDAVVYTGTHDNDTTLGWFHALDAAAQQRVLDTLDVRESMPRALVHAALESVAQLAVIPLQDILELGSDHRMNTPGVTHGNWRWKFSWDQFEDDKTGWWRDQVERSGRSIREA